MAFKEQQSAAQVAIRKRDDLKIALYVKARKEMAKEMSKLVSSAVRCITRPGAVVVCIGDAELADVIGDVVEVTVTVSLALFNGMAASLGSRKSTWMMGLRLKKKAKKVKVEEEIQELQQVGSECLWCLRKKGDEEVRMTLKKMQGVEICVGGIESGSEKVFRSLINARVSLLNTLTQ